MTKLTPTIAAEVVAACRANAAEAAGALGRALSGEFTLSAAEATTYDSGASPAGFDGPGLVVLLRLGELGVVAVLPESSGMLPTWYGAPDAAGASTLSALAQELGTLLLPEGVTAEVFAAAGVANIRASLARSGVAVDAAHASMEVASGANQGQLSLIWPLASPDAVFDSASSPSSSTGDDGGRRARAPQAASFSQLPNYSRSLLKVAVPVSVRLASKKETVQEVVEIVPGSIIKFEKGCDELLHMIIGGQQIAEGEAVKIGDKFGFRVTAMLLPSEHFVPLKRRSA